MSRILIVDDEPAICWSLSGVLTDQGHVVKCVASAEQARELLSDFQPEAIVLDVRLPGQDGLSALPLMRQELPNTPFVVMTAFGDLPTASKAFGLGVFEYLIKPFQLGEFSGTISRALASQLSQAVSEEQGGPAENIVGRSTPMQKVFRQVALLAPTDFPVLVTGETGTGKELIARAIHEHSPRSAHPFIAISLASLSPSVIESELFGHVKGAFTGANVDRPGLFELADQGTIFLDELAEIPVPIQVKLLRVLESKRYSRVGSGTETYANVRLVAATNRNLHDLMKAEQFREDLYHRLAVFVVELPALRERLDDLRLLAEHFLKRHDPALRPANVHIEFWNELERRVWPGNVRELRNAIDHAVVLARGQTLLPEHLPSPISTSKDSQAEDPESKLADAVLAWTRSRLNSVTADDSPEIHRNLIQIVERVLLKEILATTNSNRTASAKLLGLDRTTLRTKLRQLLGLESEG